MCIRDSLCVDQNITILPVYDPKYPLDFYKINPTPANLFYKGDISLLNAPKITIVGSRKTNKGGQDWAFKLAEDLSNEGFVIVSGGAVGVDAAAHKGALNGSGKTIIIFGNGLRYRLLYRNRLLAALSPASVIVSSDIHGGALVQIHYAKKYGKQIFYPKESFYPSAGVDNLKNSNFGYAISGKKDLLDKLSTIKQKILAE